MTHHSRLAQRGMSLIGAMVGLVISMLIVMTLMSAYRSVVRLTVDSNVDAQQSGDLSTAFLFAHMSLSDAGRNMRNATPAADLRLCANTALVTGTLSGCDPGVSRNAIFWRLGDPDDPDPDNPTTFFCAGLLASPGGQLEYLEQRSCGRPDFPLDGWTTLTLIQAAPTNPQFQFTVRQQTCHPLGVPLNSDINGIVEVTISSQHVGSGTNLQSTTCLIGLR